MRASDRFDASSGAVTDLTETVTKTGIMASEGLSDENLLLECINCISATANEALAKSTDRFGYAESRMMVRMCYLEYLPYDIGGMTSFSGLSETSKISR